MSKSFSERVRHATYITLPFMSVLLPISIPVIPLALKTGGWTALSLIFTVVPALFICLFVIFECSRRNDEVSKSSMMSLLDTLLLNVFYFLVIILIMFFVDTKDEPGSFSIAHTYFNVPINVSSLIFVDTSLLAIIALIVTLVHVVYKLVRQKLRRN